MRRMSGVVMLGAGVVAGVLDVFEVFDGGAGSAAAVGGGGGWM